MIHSHSLLVFFQSWFPEFFDSCDGFFARFWLPNNGWVRWSSRLQGISSPSRYGCYVKGSMTPALMDDNFPESWPFCLSLRATGWRVFLVTAWPLKSFNSTLQRPRELNFFPSNISSYSRLCTTLHSYLEISITGASLNWCFTRLCLHAPFN